MIPVSRMLGFVALDFLSANLLLLYFDSAMRYSAAWGIPRVARETETRGSLALIFLGSAILLQPVCAWLIHPREANFSRRMSIPILSGLPAQSRLQQFGRYGFCLIASVAFTLFIFSFLFFLAERTEYLQTILKVLRLD
jgi:hypothetical protein